MRNMNIVIEEIKKLVSSKGFIYAFCMILFEDFHVNLLELHKIDNWKRLSINEAAFLLGFVIKDELDFSYPESPQNLILLKKRIYELMEELHQSFSEPFFDELKDAIENKKNSSRESYKDFFKKGKLLTEPIFYSGTGVYDFQYLELLENKYKYDTKWLLENKDFDISDTIKIVKRIKEVLQEKSKKINLIDLKENLPELINKFKLKKHEDEFDKLLPLMELYQYVKLFLDPSILQNFNSDIEFRDKSWESFYSNLIELSTIKKTDISDINTHEAFLNNFSLTPSNTTNDLYNSFGDYNVIKSHPIIKLDEERYFITISFLLHQAVYESPFYWMFADKKYKIRSSEHRGKVGEEISYNILAPVFNSGKIYKSVKLQSLQNDKSTKRRKDETDADVLCIIENKALCVQVKSKKLTELSRKGNDEQLKSDFKEAVQDAYEQGLKTRDEILGKSCKLIDSWGTEIHLSEDIDEVYIMCLTTENYPSLTHQANILLNKNENDPYPLVLTVFDLELLTHYMSDPFDFLYYIRQRAALMEYFNADEEMTYLGYHLDQKLWKDPNATMTIIDSNYAQIIDRNYYPIKAGINVPDEGDRLKTTWKNELFSKLCNELKDKKYENKVDILFQLYDLSGVARDGLINYMTKLKLLTRNESKSHNFSIPPDENYSPRMGTTYMSLNSDNEDELNEKLLTLTESRKYKSKGDIWVGFGSLKNSTHMVDAVTFKKDNWKFNEVMEEKTKMFIGDNEIRNFILKSKNVGRNEKCQCGSGLKYKKCCGKN